VNSDVRSKHLVSKETMEGWALSIIVWFTKHGLMIGGPREARVVKRRRRLTGLSDLCYQDGVVERSSVVYRYRGNRLGGLNRRSRTDAIICVASLNDGGGTSFGIVCSDFRSFDVWLHSFRWALYLREFGQEDWRGKHY
jgi:hypothetical protein